MKIKFNLPAAALGLALFSTINIQLSTAFAQGNLAPPGPPGATMLTLSQVEPRTPISSVPFTIANPGSYYLTTNLACTASNGIVINANSVTLDLNGFTIISTVANAASGGAAIILNSGLSDITICNGHIRSGVTNNGSGVYSGSGFAFGILAGSSSSENVLVSRVSVSGCLYDGIYLYTGNSTLAESCTVRTVGNDGIVAATVKQSSSIDCGSYAIDGDQVLDCWGQSDSYAILANYTAQNCYGSSSGPYGAGVNADTAENCYGYSAGHIGIIVSSALNCFGYSSSGDGIDASTAENCCGQSNGSGYGISVATAENCYGYSGGGGYGLYASGVANGCYGYSYTGTGLYAFIASLCHGAVYSGTPLSTTHNVNSF